jgi:hypothetical protein
MADIQFKALSQQDIMDQLKVLKPAQQKDFDNICTDFCNTVTKLIVMARKRATQDDDIAELERLRRMLSFMPSFEKFMRCQDKIWVAREKIRTRDAKFFLDRDYSANIKKDQNQTMLETLIEALKTNFEIFTEAEKALYWSKAEELLQYVIRFKKLIGDYHE